MRALLLVILFVLNRSASSLLGDKWGEWSTWGCNMARCVVQRSRICMNPHTRDGQEMCGDVPAVLMNENITLGSCDRNATCPSDCRENKWRRICQDCSHVCNMCARLSGVCVICADSRTMSSTFPDCSVLVRAYQPRKKTDERVMLLLEWIFVCSAPLMLTVLLCYKKLQAITDAQDAILNIERPLQES